MRDALIESKDCQQQRGDGLKRQIADSSPNMETSFVKGDIPLVTAEKM